MAKILFAWELGGGLGHCVKLAPIAASLIERGRNVFFAARDIATAHRVFGDLPVQYLPAPYLAGRPTVLIRETRTFAHILHNTGFSDDEQLKPLVNSWLNLLDLVKPAAILCEHAPLALVASRLRDIRRMVIGTGFSLPPDVSPFPALRPASGGDENALAQHEQQILDRVNCLLATKGGTRLDRLSQLYADVDEQFLVTFRELDHHPVRESSAEYLGAWSPPGGETPPWPAGTGPKIFAYLKPSAQAWRVESTLALLREMDARTIAYVADSDASLHKLQSPSLLLSQGRVDISAIASQCDLAVLHGTAGSTTQFLLAGVPLLLMPLHLEQAVLSHRVVQLGAGLLADPRRVEQVAARLWTLLAHQRFRDRAHAFAARYREYDALHVQRSVSERIELALSH